MYACARYAVGCALTGSTGHCDVPEPFPCARVPDNAHLSCSLSTWEGWSVTQCHASWVCFEFKNLRSTRPSFTRTEIVFPAIPVGIGVHRAMESIADANLHVAVPIAVVGCLSPLALSPLALGYRGACRARAMAARPAQSVRAKSCSAEQRTHT